MMKKFYVITLCCLALNGCSNNPSQGNKYNDGPLVDNDKLNSLKKRAELGNGDAQGELSIYLREIGDNEGSDYWQEKCLKLRVPACLVNEAGQLLAKAENSQGEERAKYADAALKLVDEAIEKSDSSTASTYENIRKSINNINKK